MTNINRNDEKEGQEGSNASQLHDDAAEIGAQDDQITMCDIDHPHHAKAQAQAKPEQGIERSEHQTPEEGFDRESPCHIPK